MYGSGAALSSTSPSGDSVKEEDKHARAAAENGLTMEAGAASSATAASPPTPSLPPLPPNSPYRRFSINLADSTHRTLINIKTVDVDVLRTMHEKQKERIWKVQEQIRAHACKGNESNKAGVSGNNCLFYFISVLPSSSSLTSFLSRSSITPWYILIWILLFVTHGALELLMAFRVEIPLGADVAMTVVAVPWMLFCFVVESTRVDRTLLRALTRCFEFWLLLVAILVQVVLAVSFLKQGADRILVIRYYCVGALLDAYALFTDAMIHLPHGIKASILGWRCLNLLGTYAMIRFDKTSSENEYLCLGIICGNTGTLRQSCIMQVFLFTLKYLFITVVHPHQFIILGQAMKYECMTVPADMSEEEVQEEGAEAGNATVVPLPSSPSGASSSSPASSASSSLSTPLLQLQQQQVYSSAQL